MNISTINYRGKIFKQTNLSKIMGVPTYETLHHLHNEINYNAMAVHSNLEGGQQICLGKVIILTAYALLTNINFFRQAYKGKVITPIAATRHAQEELKLQYDKNLRVFHEKQGVERALIKQLVLAV